MKLTNAKPDSYDEYSVESNEKHPKFQVCYRARISKYKNNFAKGYTPNWSEEGFVVSKIKKKVPWAYVISDLNSEEVNVTFWEKYFQKRNQKEFRIEKVTNGKGNKLNIKWKGYGNSFNKTLRKMSHCVKWVNSFLTNINVFKEMLKSN